MVEYTLQKFLCQNFGLLFLKTGFLNGDFMKNLRKKWERLKIPSTLNFANTLHRKFRKIICLPKKKLKKINLVVIIYYLLIVNSSLVASD